MGGTIWQVKTQIGKTVLYTLYALGWALLFASTYFINHFDLFGLRQVWLHLRGREYTALNFGTPILYKYVRHPLYIGWFTTFWATPTMTVRAPRLRPRKHRLHPPRDPLGRARSRDLPPGV